ncbi:MAG: succinyldiaminopimelate transaminase [Micromonosporaceae bacterium]
MAGRTPLAGRLPSFPWDSLVAARERASAHPDGLVDLSMGTPVDPTPAVVRDALAAAADSPGYPLTAGSTQLRSALTDWVRRRCGAAGDVGVLPVIGTKEIVAWLPTLLGLGPGDVVAYPRLAYPTYEVGARLAGAEPVAGDSLTALGPAPVGLLWLNSPSNPTGRVLPDAHLRKSLDWARERGAVVASDECYLELGYEPVPGSESASASALALARDAAPDAAPVAASEAVAAPGAVAGSAPVSVLSVCDGDYSGVLAVHSLSKRSNLAGYRAGFVAGDPALVAELLAVRKNAGMIVPAPVQAAMIAALSDDRHVAEQRERYAARRTALWSALEGAGFRIEHSEAGLYLWATRDEDCWRSVDWLAERGILVAPGAFYGDAGAHHVRVALTATDARVAAAVTRLG